MNLPIPLAEVFTAAGVVTWAAALAGLVELAKRALPFIPDHGRGVLYLVMALSGGIIGLAATFTMGPPGSNGRSAGLAR